MRALGDISDLRAVEPLVSLLNESGIKDKAYLRLELCEALGKPGDPRAIDPLIKILENRNELHGLRAEATRDLFKV